MHGTNIPWNHWYCWLFMWRSHISGAVHLVENVICQRLLRNLKKFQLIKTSHICLALIPGHSTWRHENWSTLFQFLTCCMPAAGNVWTNFDLSSWWRNQMETFSVLLVMCAGNSPVHGEFPTQRPATRSFDVFFHLRPNKRLRKQWQAWWCETAPLWRHCNDEYHYDAVHGSSRVKYVHLQ